MLILVFGAWAGVVWQTGQSIAKAQAEQLALVRLNEARTANNERRVDVVELNTVRFRDEITRLREQMAVATTMLEEIRRRLRVGMSNNGDRS